VNRTSGVPPVEAYECRGKSGGGWS